MFFPWWELPRQHQLKKFQLYMVLMHPTSQPIDLMWVLNKWKYNSTPVYGAYVEEQTLRYAAQISD